MGHSSTTAPAPPNPIAPPSVQPGGSFIMKMELLWGRLRRARLRLFGGGHLRRMEAIRLGTCPGCRHSILDSRDLKYCRNVCGYSFREEEDPYRWRNELGFARYGLAEVTLSTLLVVAATFFVVIGVNFVSPWLWLVLPLVLIPWGFILLFFRDPERTIPSDPAALVSPADGTVTHVDEVNEPDFPGGRARRVSIFLAVWDVHVNRAPRRAKVVGLRYFPGRFLDARNPESSRENEQFWTDFEESSPPRRIRVKQVSGAIARRIINWLRPDESVWAGSRIGMIKFGSRTEVLIPASDHVEVQVQVGDKVQGGSTVLLRFL
jgi:phosphatidylserine decarboxylase